MEDLRCKICMEKFTHQDLCPKMLNCGHTICSHCLGKILTNGQCPFCRARLSSSSLRDYPTNYTILELIGAEKSSLNLPECQVHQSKSEYVCIDCQNFVCHSCIISKHSEHNFKKIKDYHAEITKKLKTRAKMIEQIKERAEFFETIQENFLDNIKKSMDSKVEALIKSIKENRIKIFEELETLKSRCSKRTNLKNAPFKLWESNDISVKDLFYYDKLSLEEWDSQAFSYWRGDIFYDNFKEFAHVNFVWSDLLETSKIETLFYLDQSSCEKSECETFCKKIHELKNFSFQLSEKVNLRSSSRSYYDDDFCYSYSHSLKKNRLISENFLLTSLEIFESEFEYHKNIILAYNKDCKMEKFYKENIDNIKRCTSNLDTLAQISSHYRNACTDIRRNDKLIACKKPLVNTTNLSNLSIPEDQSYILFMLSYLSHPSMKKFFLKNYSASNNHLFNNSKILLRKIFSSSKQKITPQNITDLFLCLPENRNSRDDVLISYMKSFGFINSQIKESKIQLNAQDQITQKYETQCPNCNSAYEENLPMIELKLPNVAVVEFSSYSLRKKFIFSMPSPCYLKELKQKVLELAPSIYVDCLIVLNKDFKLIGESTHSTQIYVFENPSPLGYYISHNSIAKLVYNNSYNSEHYYFSVSNSKQSIESDIKTITQDRAKSLEFRSIEFHQKGGEIKRIGSNPEIRFSSYSNPFSFEVSRSIPISLLSENLEQFKCANCDCSTSLSKLPNTFIAYKNSSSSQFRMLDFKLGDKFSEKFPHKLYSVLTIDDSNKNYKTYFRNYDEECCSLDVNECRRLDSSKTLSAEPFIMIYSMHE